MQSACAGGNDGRGGGENYAICNGCEGEENVKNGNMSDLQEVSPEPHLSNHRDIMSRKDVILIIIGSLHKAIMHLRGLSKTQRIL